jgi:peroxiredoxin
MMKSVLAVAIATLSLVAARPAAASLAVGGPAPHFSTRGAQGGKTMTVDLAELLQKGAVVLFFFPSAFTDAPECRAFAENIDKFSAAGVSVVGASRDGVDTLVRFSSEECAGKFPLASADENLVNSFDVNDGATFNTRTTYVIAPSGKIAFVHDDNDYSSHVRSVLAFVQGMNTSPAKDDGAQ